MKSSTLSAFAHRMLIFLLVLAMLLPAMPTSVAFAQETPPDGNEPAEPVVDLPFEEGVEAALVDETTETPTVLISSGATSYDVANPGVYWMTKAFCESPPPNVAAAEGDAAAEGNAVVEGDAPTLADDGAPDQQDHYLAPAEGEAATTFYIRRTTVNGYDTRTLQNRPDTTGGQPWVCNGQYHTNSNVVADQAHVYWVDNTGLVRIPVTANPTDAPQVVDATWRSDETIHLRMVGKRLFGALNRNPTGSGQFQIPGSSSLRYYDTSSGETKGVAFSLAVNSHFNSPQYDGTYVFFKKGTTLFRANLDGTGETQVAANVGVYYSDGLRGQLCLIGQPCPNTHYLFYTIYSGGVSVIYRRNFVNNETAGIQTRSGRTIGAIMASSMPSNQIFGQRRVFWIESVFTPDPGGGFGGTTTWSLMRASFGSNGTISNLYNVQDASLNFREILDLRSDGTFAFWRDNGIVRRLPLDAAALPKVNVRVTGIELTQGIQDDGNSVRLIKGRQTWARVFVKSDGVDVPNLTLTLTSSEGGGTIYPSGPFLTVKGSPSKNALGDSYVFLLPSSWTDQANLTLYAHLNPIKIPFEPDYTDNEFASGIFTLSDAHPMEVVLYPASYSFQAGSGSATFYDRPTTFEHFDRIMRSYPLAEEGLKMRVRNMAGGQQLGSRVNQSHMICQAMKADSRSLCAAEWLYAQIFLSHMMPGLFSGEMSKYHYGLIDDGLMFPRGRVVDVGLPLGAGPASNDGSSDYGYYTAHEVAHELNRNHPTPGGDDSSTSAVEGCGHSRSDNAFPYAGGFIGFGDGSIRGFDRAQPTSTGSRVALYTDTQSNDVMTYCGNAQERWTSPYTWEGLYTWLRDHSAASAVQAAAVTGGEVLALAGSLHGDTLSVLAVGIAPSGMELGTTPGAPWTLRQRDGANSILADYAFAIEDDGEGALFNLVVPLAAGATKIEIVGVGNAVKWSQAISAAAPVVSNVALSPVASPISGTVTLNWEATDGDGDALTYDILYSVDGGATWQPVTFDIATTSAPVDTNVLPGGTARFRVIANDGVNTGQADSGDYAVTRKGPEIEILTPSLGQHYNWRETVPLSVYAMDLADGSLDGTSIEWSNEDGPLGTGAYLATASLPTGPNLITVKATNSAGYWTSESITIYIDDALQGLPATLVAVPNSLNFQVALGVTEPQTKTLALDYIGASGAINWTASVDAPWVTLGATSGTAVPAALAVGVYPAGLAENELHEATITIVATPGVGEAHTVVVPVTLAIGNTMFSVNEEGTASASIYLPLIGK